jgi:hypothetical protein
VYTPVPEDEAAAPVPTLCWPVNVNPPLPSKVMDPSRLRTSLAAPLASSETITWRK